MTKPKLQLTLQKEHYSLAEFTEYINFMLQDEDPANAYWITTNGTQVPMQRISIPTAYGERLYNGFAIIE